MLERLEAELHRALPRAQLRVQEVAGLRLALLDEAFPREPLDAASFRAVWDSPPYWAFAWPAGIELARAVGQRELLEPIVDLGCGSGIVALACAQARKDVVAVDIDPAARLAAQVNASLNGLELAISEHLPERCGTLVLADFLYDPANLRLLPDFQSCCHSIMLGDCRLKHVPEGFELQARTTGHVVPNLDWNDEFSEVLLATWTR